MNADSPNGVRELEGPASSEHEDLIESYLESIKGMSLREAEERTGVSDAAIDRMRNGQRTVRKRTEEKIVNHLRSRGLWPRPPTAAEVRATRGGRAELAFRHFTSPALMKHFNWSPTQVVSALFLLAEEQDFTPAETAELGELTNLYLRVASEEGP